LLTTDGSTGAVLATQRFDAFGNKTAGAGSVPTYGYASREPDITGLTYLRVIARRVPVPAAVSSGVRSAFT